MSGVIRATLKCRQYSGLMGVQATRAAGAWNKDWKPGPYPETPEQRKAAARKYGLSEDEYKPYPDDGVGKGDYPDLPLITAESRDPYYNWDYPEHRRNFGEPVHADFDMYGLDRVNASQKLRFSASQQFLTFAAIMAFFFGSFYALQNRKLHWPLLAKQYPQDGATHYTFEKPE